MSSHHYAVPASYLILEKDGKVLLMRRQGTNYYKGWYCVPSGHVEKGELPSQGLIREVKEEVGLDLDPSKIRLVHTMYRTAHDITGDRADYFFVVSDWSGEPSIAEPDKCDDLQWFPIDQLPENTMHHVRDAIDYWQRDVNFSEYSSERTHRNPST